MQSAYVAVLLCCSAAVAGLVAWRVAQWRKGPRPERSRLINEWIWTLVPLAVLAVLLWQAAKMAK